MKEEPKLKPEFLMLNILSRVCKDYKNLFPEDALNNERLSAVLQNLAWRIKEKYNYTDVSTETRKQKKTI